MRKLVLSLFLLTMSAMGALAQGGPSVGPTNQILCNKVAQLTVATATTTSAITGVTSQAIHLCGWHVTSTQAASTTFQVEYGTQGGPCGSAVLITPAFSVTSTAPSGDHQQFAFMSTPNSLSGSAVQMCIISTGSTVGLAITLYYAQF